MTWNWQTRDWPHFRFDPLSLQGLENEYIRQAGRVDGALQHLAEPERLALTLDMLGEEAIKTSEIEGEILRRDSVQSSIRRQFGLETDNRRIPHAEKGAAMMTVDVYQTGPDTLTQNHLLTWHALLMQGREDLQAIGKYRTHDDPMQIVSGNVYDPRVHFEAPPSKTMNAEMKRFIDWFDKTAPNGPAPLPALIRAGIAHLYFVSIHPFEDGNGRIARALSEKCLAQALGRPTLMALAHAIQSDKKEYYRRLELNNKDMEITDWLLYFAKTALEAQQYTQTLIDFTIGKTKLYDRIRPQLNERQAKVIDRMFREGPSGFIGGLSAENYIAITQTSRATATRDLQSLVEIGALTRTGERKHTRYFLSIQCLSPAGKATRLDLSMTGLSRSGEGLNANLYR